MKKDLHPTMNPVVFIDTSSGEEFITKSTITSEEKKEIDGVEHFIIRLEISSSSHPFYTGKDRFVDTAGRVDKFKEKMERAAAAKKEKEAIAKKKKARTESKEEKEEIKEEEKKAA